MLSSKKESYRGYVTCREFGGLIVPVPVQSKLLRDYCISKNFTYKLHVNENRFESSYIVLNGLLNEIDKFDGLLISSMFMLPKKIQKRAEFYELVLSKNKKIHFVMEEVVLKNLSDCKEIEEVLRLHHVMPKWDEIIEALSQPDAVI